MAGLIDTGITYQRNAVAGLGREASNADKQDMEKKKVRTAQAQQITTGATTLVGAVIGGIAGGWWGAGLGAGIGGAVGAISSALE